MSKLGLKLWSINTDSYYKEAIRLYNENVFDYIELYVVPDTTNLITKWKNINIPVALHAPHYAHNLNFSKKENETINKKLTDEVREYAKELNPLYTVFHPGIGGHLDETIRQMKEIKDIDFLVENKPYIVPIDGNNVCIGATIQSIKQIIKATGCGFCLDVGHGICAANYIKEEPYGYIEKLTELNPKVCHISDNDIKSELDHHWHFQEGNYNLAKIKNMIQNISYCAIETVKDSKENLDDFAEDVKKISEICV